MESKVTVQVDSRHISHARWFSIISCQRYLGYAGEYKFLEIVSFVWTTFLQNKQIESDNWRFYNVHV